MNYKEFKKISGKSVDSWVEVLLFDPLENPLTYILYKLFPSKKTPYIVTLFSFLVRCIAGFYLFFGHILTGIFLILLGFISDGIDGKVSRAVNSGKDPELRGTLDFLSDNVAALFIFMGLANIIPGNLMLLYIFYLISQLFDIALSSTKFRLSAIQGINPKKTLLTQIKKKKSFIHKIQNAFQKHKFIMHPSIVESNFTLWILFPLFYFNIWVLLIAILFMWIDILVTFVPIYFLLKSK